MRRDDRRDGQDPPTKSFFPRASNILKFVALRVAGKTPPLSKVKNPSVRGGGPRQKRHSARGAAAQDAAPSSDPQRGRGATAFKIKKCNITRKKDESKNKKKTTRTLRGKETPWHCAMAPPGPGARVVGFGFGCRALLQSSRWFLFFA